MSLLYLLLVLALFGLILWLINTYIPMDPKIKKVINIVAIVAVVLWLLRALGVFGYLEQIKL